MHIIWFRFHIAFFQSVFFTVLMKNQSIPESASVTPFTENCYFQQ